MEALPESVCIYTIIIIFYFNAYRFIIRKKFALFALLSMFITWFIEYVQGFFVNSDKGFLMRIYKMKFTPTNMLMFYNIFLRLDLSFSL